jgi:alkaline phosphatase
MRSTLITAAFAQAAVATIQPRNVIFIVPDGMAPASETLARTYEAMINGIATPGQPLLDPIPIDDLPVGNVRTHSANNLVTDSAAAGTALATGFKTNNSMIGVNPVEEPVGTILEAAKFAGMKTGLVVTSIMNHATPAAFSSHTINRNGLPFIAAQQVGHSHPLNQSVDVLLGGGACYFKPSSDPNSCREDDIDLLAHAESLGYYITENRAGFDALAQGQSNTSLPYLGLFSNDTDLAYEIDRQQQPEDVREPSLVEMTEVALNALTRETTCHGFNCTNVPGYFIMIEASRIDHASHAHDGAAHLHDVLAYNRVIEFVKSWIDEHTDTALISVADHETGGLTLPSGWDPRPLANATHSVEYLQAELEDYSGDEAPGFVADQLLAYGIQDANETLVDSLVDSNSYSGDVADLLNAETGLAWSTGGHTGVDVTLYAYAHGEMGKELVRDLAGSHDNTELPRLIEKYLGLDMDEITRQLREDVSWLQ